MNTQLAYLYRDASNYKTFNRTVLEGTLTDAEKDEVISCLDDGEWFIPSAVGLEEDRPSEWDEQDDHPWFELYRHGIEDVSEPSFGDITAREFLERMRAMKGKWGPVAAAREAELRSA